MRTVTLSIQPEAMMSFALKSTEAGARVGGQTVNNLRFADDIDLVAEDDGQLQELTDEVHSSSQRFGLKINVEKTKTITIGKQQKTVEIKIERETLEQVTDFIYLGGVITEDGRCTKDIKRRIGLASAMFGTMNKMWRSNNIGLLWLRHEPLQSLTLRFGANSFLLLDPLY